MRKRTILIIVFGVGFLAYSIIHYVNIPKVKNKNELSTNVEMAVISEADLTNTLGAKMEPEEGEHVAQLVIPTINKSYDVYWGTDEHTLEKGVGMYVSEWTVTPDIEAHTVLSGHRDSVFRPVGDLEKGDRLYVSYRGIDYEYRIHKIWITDANDRTVIVEKEEPTLTLTTCYPFYYVGSAPDRYIIQAKLVQKGNLLESKTPT